VFGSYLSSLYSNLILYCGGGLAYPYDWRGFVRKKIRQAWAFYSSMESVVGEREKGRDAIDLSTGSYFSQALLRKGAEGVEII
jgi:hypothetical protein